MELSQSKLIKDHYTLHVDYFMFSKAISSFNNYPTPNTKSTPKQSSEIIMVITITNITAKKTRIMLLSGTW